MTNAQVQLKWHGAAHYHIFYQDMRIVVDPLYTRLPGDVPHLEERKEDLEKIDYLLLTHGHLDHSCDFPYLLFKHAPVSYAPEEYLHSVKRRAKRDNIEFDFSRCHSLEDVEGTPVPIGDVEITPYRIGTEEIDLWFIRSMFVRPLIHKRPETVPFGFRWLSHHLYCNCFVYLFRFPPDQKTMLYFGNLTDQVEGLQKIERVNVLALSYCPANKKWKAQSRYLIRRFSPDVVLVHHFDNFMNPYTLSKYLDLADYKHAIREECPDATLVFSKFNKMVGFEDIACAKKSE
jgi:L-ascorbate metabolism protein UlaG (beta-lactamase superfamily)